MLIDGGATYNFIDSTLVTRRGIPTEDFEGFSVVVAGGCTMPCIKRVPRLNVTLGNYNLTDDFYVVDLADTNAVLGVQWLSTLGTISQNYQAMEMGFNAPDGKRVVLRGMSNGSPRVVSSKRMEALFGHGDVAYAAECLITT